jgi:succinate-acetate transporter protein
MGPRLPHKASILQVLDWRVGNTTNKAHQHFLFLFVFLTIYLFLMSMCSLTILQHVFVNPLILFEL